MQPKLVADYDISRGAPDSEAIMKFMCDERGYGPDWISKTVRLLTGASNTSQKTFDRWF